ncbi:MAG: hypothetical protein FWC68_04270 [Oscillospiraceae bacterium]|nr:hypothetical protein [Oscillospiraceae bacterium]
MKQYMILFKKDFLELYRTKRILIIAIIFVLFALTSPLLASLLPELIGSLEVGNQTIQLNIPDATIVDSNMQLVNNLDQAGILTLIACLGGLIVKERKTGLYNNLLNNGVKKSNFILSKISVQVLVVTAIYIISLILFSIYNYVLFDNFLVENSILSFLAFYVYMLFILAVINLYSVLAKSTIVSIVLSILTMFLIMILDLFRFGRYLPNYLTNIATQIFNNQAYTDLIFRNIAITLVISIIIVIASIVLCKSKE